MDGGMPRWLDRWTQPFVYAVALHSFLVGAGMAFAPGWLLAFGGFAEAPSFFARQGGVFHLVLATLYVLDWRVHRRLDAMVVAKCCGSVFLLSTVLAQPSPAWALQVSFAGDVAMAVAAILMARRRPRGMAGARGDDVRRDGAAA